MAGDSLDGGFVVPVAVQPPEKGEIKKQKQATAEAICSWLLMLLRR